MIAILWIMFGVPAQEIGEVCGLVHSEVAYGMNLLKDVATAWWDTFGGRAQSLQGVMADSRKTAVAEMEEQARAMDADAIVGLAFQITQINTTNGTGMVILAATGTGVRFADKEHPNCKRDPEAALGGCRKAVVERQEAVVGTKLQTRTVADGD